MPKLLAAIVFATLIPSCVTDDRPPTATDDQALLSSGPICFDTWGDPVYDEWDDWQCDDWDWGWGGGGGGGGGGGSTGCSQTQINSLIAACHQLCAQSSSSSCGEPGVEQYCSNSTGILYCRIDHGVMDAPCAETWSQCP